jgi:hypothetical protein
MARWKRLLAELISVTASSLAQDDGQASRSFWIRELVQLVGPLESLYEEEAECRSLVADRAGFQLALFDQMRLILSDFVQAELIGWLVEVLGKIADDRQIRPRCILRVITTLEFLQHHFVQLGHRDLLSL